MGRRLAGQLTTKEFEALKDGVHSDGGNLWLKVAGKGRTWSFRYKSPTTGKRREMGLGRSQEIGLAAARRLAADARSLLSDRIDPIEEKARRQAESLKAIPHSFRSVTEMFVESRRAAWRNPRSEPLWTSSVERLVHPLIGDRPVNAITTEDILAVLEPIWTTKTETADRIRGRIEAVLDYAKTRGWRSGDNPARWKGHLIYLLSRPSTLVSVRHHVALPRERLPSAMSTLAQSDSIVAKAVRFTCLTAARSGEVRGATWVEIDLKSALWIVPAKRMKGNREHRVPLSSTALQILAEVKSERSNPTARIFTTSHVGRPLGEATMLNTLAAAADDETVTMHGLRSTFRDWVAEVTTFPGEVAEMALAHRVSDKVEAAYRRGDLLQKRFDLMEQWARFCHPPEPVPEAELAEDAAA